MILKHFRISNLASFLDFETDCELKKYTLFFGANGSGKSTLVSLLQLLDSYFRSSDQQDDTQLKTFLSKRISKENRNKTIQLQLKFNSQQTLLSYDLAKNHLSFKQKFWTPIKVFNDNYTNRTIGPVFKLDLKNSGITIGGANRDLEKANDAINSLEKQLEEKKGVANAEVEKIKSKFKSLTDSTLNVSEIISVETLLSDKCDYTSDSSLIRKRRNLGYGKPDRIVSKLDIHRVILPFEITDIVSKCEEVVFLPSLNEKSADLLREYTQFFLSGVEVYDKEGKPICPFCLRDWPKAELTIAEYRNFLKSTYSAKRKKIKDTISTIDEYARKINEYKKDVKKMFNLCRKEADKYGVDISNWKPLELNNKQCESVKNLLGQKYKQMDEAFQIQQDLEQLQSSHKNIIEENNKIIDAILNEIDSITSRRRSLNKKLAEHFAAELWSANTQIRQEISTIETTLNINKKLKIEIEQKSPPQDVINSVFNELIKFIGLGEYHIDSNNRLNLRTDIYYDISSEGDRLSSAQRKILSLCYFFAEIFSEIDRVSKLRDYILVFDDPVDSADYIFFHSITSTIEKIEIILEKVIQQKIKFGQFIVLTHNSLLHDRLSANWKEVNRCIRKTNGKSVLEKGQRSINNYSEYLREIINFYKKPTSKKSRMIYIGNLIRRVLEILASFDNLGSNDFQTLLDGMGKQKLALLANHLSHESFSRVLNPIPTELELQDACKELLEVIKDRHPAQHQTILTKFELLPASQNTASAT